jgi:hypothetical protein
MAWRKYLPTVVAVFICLLHLVYVAYEGRREYTAAHTCGCGGGILLFDSSAEYVISLLKLELPALFLVLTLLFFHPAMGILVYAIHWLSVGAAQMQFYRAYRDDYELFKLNEGQVFIYLGALLLVASVLLLVWQYRSKSNAVFSLRLFSR